ncbi:MAG: hypothetical protein R3F02_08105 [Thiolinea sp.]
MKYTDVKKMVALLFALCLTGCTASPAALAADKPMSKPVSAIPFKPKFADVLSIVTLPNYPLYMTKSSKLTKEQVEKIRKKIPMQSIDFNKKLYQTFPGGTPTPSGECKNVGYYAQSINLDQFLRKKFGVSAKELLTANMLLPEEVGREATLFAVANCTDFFWDRQFVVLRPKSAINSPDMLWLLFWKQGVIFRGATGARL